MDSGSSFLSRESHTYKDLCNFTVVLLWKDLSRGECFVTVHQLLQDHFQGKPIKRLKIHLCRKNIFFRSFAMHGTLSVSNEFIFFVIYIVYAKTCNKRYEHLSKTFSSTCNVTLLMCHFEMKKKNRTEQVSSYSSYPQMAFPWQDLKQTNGNGRCVWDRQ